MEKLFSFIIPTLNSERTLDKCLNSIASQDFDLSKIEILVIDGGSTDNTREIALKYGAKVLDNPMVQPEYAKYNIGVLNATGRYTVFLDSDEIIQNSETLRQRYNLLIQNPNVKIIIHSGYVTPGISHPINYYINSVGDPFAYFMYSNEKMYGYFYKIIKKFYLKYEDEEFVFLDREKLKLKTLLLDFASSVTVESSIIKSLISLNFDKRINFSQVFSYILDNNFDVVFPKYQPIIHYSSDSFKRYLYKIDWRIKMNLLSREASKLDEYIPAGFYEREKFMTKSERFKKILFIPYSLSILLPIIDGIKLTIRHRKLLFLFYHPLLSLFTSLLILFRYFLKLVGFRIRLGSYGKR